MTPMALESLSVRRGGRLVLGVAAVAVALSTLAMADLAGRSTRLVMLDVVAASSGQSWVVEDRMRRAFAGDYAPRAHARRMRPSVATLA